MYECYWNLQEKPFRNPCDPRFLYYSRKHEEGMVRMLYSISQDRGITVLVGESGTGKSFLCRILARELLAKRFRVVMVLNPDLDPLDMLREIGGQLNLQDGESSKARLLARLRDDLCEHARRDASTVLIVDEAHLIGDQRTLQEIRLLQNLEENGRTLLPTILVAQPDFVRLVPGIQQRVGFSYRLLPLSRQETACYVRHRMKVAGARREIFADEALAEVHGFSQGLPRQINNICDMALLIGSGDGAALIEPELVRRAVADQRGADFLAQRRDSG